MSCKGEEPRDGDNDKFSLCHFYNWFTELSNLIRTTGDVVEMGGELEPSMKGVSEHVSQGWLKFKLKINLPHCAN